MAYDHHRKAGNEGDVVKHPALIAALDAVLTSQRPSTLKSFHYLDLFAGHAWHPLLDERKIAGVQKQFEWINGIGVIGQTLWQVNEDKLNNHVKIWRDWYISQRKSLVNGWYPGSSTIAADMCRTHERAIQLTLFDISGKARSDLRRFFCPIAPSDITRNNWCVIGRSFNPMQLHEAAINEPDFVFIDPPGFDSDSALPDWRPHFDNILQVRAEHLRPTLMWLPASGTEKDWKTLTRFRRRPQQDPTTKKPNPGFFNRLGETLWANYHWSAVRWGSGGPKAACILIYNSAHRGIRDAVNCIVEIARLAGKQQWECTHSEL